MGRSGLKQHKGGAKGGVAICADMRRDQAVYAGADECVFVGGVFWVPNCICGGLWWLDIGNDTAKLVFIVGIVFPMCSRHWRPRYPVALLHIKFQI